jgi:multiple sugar transport system ATP-binding protein
VLGIRPEDIALSADLNVGDGQIDAWVELAEPLGAETYLHLTTKGTSFVARVAAAHGQFEGRQARLALDLDKAHLFDATSERRISG